MHILPMCDFVGCMVLICNFVLTTCSCELCTADANECTEGINSCHIDATCHNTRGNYTCSCNPGYTGDGFSCTGKCNCLQSQHKYAQYPPLLIKFSLQVEELSWLRIHMFLHNQLFYLHHKSLFSQDIKLCVFTLVKPSLQMFLHLLVCQITSDNVGRH